MDASYLSQQVTTIIERLHGFFDEIGVPTHERDSREAELFTALSETLHNQLNLVSKEKHDLTEEAQRLIKTIRQMERSLDDTRPTDDDFDSGRDGMQVTFPLLACLQHLKEKHHTISKLHRERFEQVKKLVEALESYASHLEPAFITLDLPPTAPNAKLPPSFDLSPTYVGKLDAEFTRVYEEYNKRVQMVAQTANEIISLWSELGTPQAQVDSKIVQFAREAPEQLGLHQDDLKRLTGKREKLVGEKGQRERRLKDLRASIETLWERLGVDEAERKQFLAANRGCGLRTINEYEDELARLNELKRQNLHLFVEDARVRLQELWDGLYFSEEEMLDFTPAFSDVYSDALLSAHEQEILRLEALKQQRAPLLAIIDRHRSLIQDREDLEKSSQDASRLMGKGAAKGEKRDPGKLLREEKMRKRITKELPKVEAELCKKLDAWEDEYGRPFCVHGERYLDELASRRPSAAPTRSKTPNAPPPAREPPKSAGGANTQPRAAAQKPAPPRSKTPMASIGRNVLATSTISLTASTTARPSKASPSKIPGTTRLPMTAMRDGNNSPERRLNGAKSHPARAQPTDRGHMAPPKMKALQIPPTPTPIHDKENEVLGGSIVRHIEPDDPYDSGRGRRMPPPAMHASLMGPPTMRPVYQHGYHAAHQAQQPLEAYSQSAPGGHTVSRPEYPLAPPSRAASNTSSVLSGGSGTGTAGSENWETYTDASADEGDAGIASHARVQAQPSSQALYNMQQQQPFKRPAPPMLADGPKRLREQLAVTATGHAGWTDDGGLSDAF